jgi:hypothetical protein
MRLQMELDQAILHLITHGGFVAALQPVVLRYRFLKRTAEVRTAPVDLLGPTGDILARSRAAQELAAYLGPRRTRISDLQPVR